MRNESSVSFFNLLSLQLLKAFTTILTLCFVLQTFSQAVYYFTYEVEKKEYVKRCENKARPLMHCNGKCQLMKKIQREQEKENGPAPEMKIVKNEVLSSRSFFADYTSSFLSTEIMTYTNGGSGNPIDRSIPLLRPPGYLL